MSRGTHNTRAPSFIRPIIRRCLVTTTLERDGHDARFGSQKRTRRGRKEIRVGFSPQVLRFIGDPSLSPWRGGGIGEWTPLSIVISLICLNFDLDWGSFVAVLALAGVGRGLGDTGLCSLSVCSVWKGFLYVKEWSVCV